MIVDAFLLFGLGFCQQEIFHDIPTWILGIFHNISQVLPAKSVEAVRLSHAAFVATLHAFGSGYSQAKAKKHLI